MVKYPQRPVTIWQTINYPCVMCKQSSRTNTILFPLTGSKPKPARERAQVKHRAFRNGQKYYCP